MSFDALKSEKYPPDSINIDKAFFDYIEDYHLRDQYNLEVAVNGSCPKNYALEPDGFTCVDPRLNTIASRPIVRQSVNITFIDVHITNTYITGHDFVGLSRRRCVW